MTASPMRGAGRGLAREFPTPHTKLPPWTPRPDFISVEVHCAKRADEAQRWARNIKDIELESQSTHPFAASGNPAVRSMRQVHQVLTDAVEAQAPVLVYRRTFPDGTPGGLIYDEYQAHCWHHEQRAGVVVELRVRPLVEREPEARQWFQEKCAALAAAQFSSSPPGPTGGPAPSPSPTRQP